MSDTKQRQNPDSLLLNIANPARINYLLYLPPGYHNDGETWPLVLFLHGAGERGSNLELLKRQGLPQLIGAGQDFPFIVLSPQCPTNERWHVPGLMSLLDEITAVHRVEAARVYVTGLSMGGFGTWELATARPERFAAALPICGGGDPRVACRAKDLPIWAFHGDADPVVPVRYTLEMAQALQACGGKVQATIYPGVGHDSWTRTYANPAVYEWLLEHRRESAPA